VAIKERSVRRKTGRKAARQSTPVIPAAERSSFFLLPEIPTAPLSIPWTVKALLIAVILLGTAVRIANFGNVTFRSPDERTYTAHALGILKNGLIGNRAFAEAQLQIPELKFNPPPTRLGFTLPVVAIMKLTGIHDERAGAYVSSIASVLSLLAAVWIGLRFFGPWIAIFGGLFLAVFPPELVMARRCWSDALTGLTGILMLYLTMEIFSGRRKWFFYVPLVLIGSEAMLVKETSILLYGPCLIIALWAFLKERDFAGAGLIVGAAAAGAIMVVGLLAYSTGGVDIPLRIFLEDARANATNTYSLSTQSGPAYLLLWAFEVLSPITFILAALGLAIAIFRNRRRRSEIAMLAWLTLGFLAIFMFMPLWLNLRYAAPAYGPLCLFAGAALWQVFSKAGQKLPRDVCYGFGALALAAVMLFLFADYQRFERAFVGTKANDLSIGVIRAALSN